MESKDLALLMLMPIILIGIILYTNNIRTITGAVIKQEDKSNILGTYYANPSFRAKIDYDLEDYSKIREKLDAMLEFCKNKHDIEKCLRDKSVEFGWGCAEKEEHAVLYDFLDKFKDCINLKEENVVCKFSLDERKFDKKRKFEIVFTDEFRRIKAELKEDNNVLAADYIEMENLLFTDDFNKKDTDKNPANSIMLNINYEEGKPNIEKFAAIAGSKEIKLSRIFLFYKLKNDVKFIDEEQEPNFRAPTPANKIISLPRTKGIKFCAKSDKKAYAYDSSDNTVKSRDIIYRFAVAFPKPAPSQIENLDAVDALNAEKSAILTWEKKEEDIAYYSIYYSKGNFIDIKIEDIKQDKEVNKKHVPNSAIEIEDIDLTKCIFEQIGKPCKYAVYNKALEINKLYYWKAKNKLVYLLAGVEDGVEHNFAVTAVNDKDEEISNDKDIEGSTLELNKNYKKFMPIDDLAPAKVQNLEHKPANNKIKLTWSKPIKNIDGSTSFDIANFNIYYKKYELIQPQSVFLGNFNKKTIKASDANCGEGPAISCGYIMEELETSQTYSVAVTALDNLMNERNIDADLISVP